MLIFSRFILLIFVLLSSFLVSFHTKAQDNVDVTITIDTPQHHYATIYIVYDNFSESEALLKLPTWRTGRYEIINLANGIREFSVVDGQNNALLWKKTAKDTWKVSNTLHKKLIISYQVYANQLGQRTRHIDDSHAFLDFSTVVMYSDKTRAYPYTINMQVPVNWRSVSGLSQGKNKNQFIAKNYDVLVDSPVETGINEYHEFKVDDRDFALVIWGKGNYDSKQMVKDLAKIVKQSQTIWQGYPFKRYVFMVHATSGARGATEHLNSTIIQTSRYNFASRKDYLRFISTAAHEFVHTWNVKQYRPKGLVPYDYQHENYSTLLWLSEGSTSYLQNQLLLRSGLMTSKEFLTMLAKRITGYEHKQGRKSQTVAQSSFDKWLEEGGDYDSNHSVNIYSEGFLVSWMLDFSLIEKTKLSKSYRDVHNILYRDFKIPNSFDENDLLNVLQKVSKNDYRVWWQKNIHGFANPDFSQLLAKAGLKISYGKDKEIKKKAWAGLKTKQANNGLQITRIEKNSPAWKAGLMTDDIIIAVEGLRMKDKDLTERMTNFKPKDRIAVTFFRRDELYSRMIILGEQPAETLKVVPMKDASVNQKAFYKQWTGLDFPLPNNK